MSPKVLVFLALEALYFVYCHSSFDSHPEESLVTVFFKCLPIAYLIRLCATTKPHDAEHKRYRDEVTIGLLFSIIGDACLVWRHTLFIPGAAFFAGAHFFYIRAFRLKPWGLETGGFILVAWTVVVLFFLQSVKERKDIVVLLAYLVLIFSMWWRAIVRWQRDPNLSSLMANLGAFVFLASDFCIAVDKWKMELPMAAVIIMSLYYLAQFLVTMSVYVVRAPELDDEDSREKKRGWGGGQYVDTTKSMQAAEKCKKNRTWLALYYYMIGKSKCACACSLKRVLKVPYTNSFLHLRELLSITVDLNVELYF